MASQSRPEPMNASPHHSKIKVTLSLSDPVYVVGRLISGKMEVESRADLDSLLGIGPMMVELYAIQEVNSGEHSATSTFIHSCRIFQGPGLPPSNAVYSDHVPRAGESSLPAHHYAALRGQTTFFFQFPIPASSPSSITFGPASIRYEIRASVSVAWRGDKRLVTDKREVKVVESWDPTDALLSQAVAITEGGKIWAQATLTNIVVVGGESACINLQLKNHTQRWTSGVTIALSRELHFSQSFLAGRSSPNISDVTTQVEFRGPEYSVPPGTEGIASLVIDIPRHSRGVKGGLPVDDNRKTTEGFFEVRCILTLRVDMPPGSEDTVLTLPLTIHHSLAVPEAPASPPHLTSSPCPYGAPVSSGLLSPPPGTELIPAYTGNRIQHYDPTWLPPSPLPVSNYLPNQHLEQDTHNWQHVPCPYESPMQRSISVGLPLQAPYYTPGLSTPYAPSPRLLPPSPIHVSSTGYGHPATQIETIDGYTIPDHFKGAIASPASQNIPATAHLHSASPIPQPYPSQSHVHDRLPTPNRARLPPIQIPPLPNPHDSQGVLHSPRPMPSPKHSFYGSVPKSNNVSQLERMANEVGKQTSNLSLDLPEGDAGVDVQGPQAPGLDRQPDFGMDKTLPTPPVPSSKDKHHFQQRPHVDALFTTKGTMANHSGFPSSTNLPHAPPTPPMAAITPIKFPKAPTELSGLGANLGKDVPPESGLDALERRLLAEVGTRKFDAEERPHLRSVVQPITIPPSGPLPDTVNDSAISSLTLADREGILKATPEREQEQDRDSDERTQHMGGGGHSPSEDDRDARTQKGKSSRKLCKSKHSEEDPERAGHRRERKKVKDEEGRKLRREAKGRVAAWLGEIDISAPPVTDDSGSFISPTASHFVPITESASFGPAPVEMTDVKPEESQRQGEVSMDKDVSASPNPRSSGFVTISSLKATNGSGGEASPFKPSPRRSSVNEFRHAPASTPDQPTTTARRPPMSRSPSAEVKRSEPADPPHLQPQPQPQSPLPAQPGRLFPARLPRFPPKPVDPEVKYDIRSARGGKGGKVTQVASLWAAKLNTNANAKANANPKPKGDTTSVSASAPKRPKLTSPPVVRKPVLNVLKRGSISTRSPAASLGAADTGDTGGAGGATAGLNHAGETRTGTGAGMGAGAGTGKGVGAGLGMREVSKMNKATTVPAVLSSSHAVPMLSSTASLARVKAHGPGQSQTQVRSLPPMISETISDWRNASKGAGIKTGAGAGAQGRGLGELAFGQARLRDLIKKYQG